MLPVAGQVRQRCRQRALVLTGLLALLLASGSGARLLAQASASRSSAQPRRWLPDERQEPRYLERATHRGFEVSTGPIHVVAATSASDARQAAEQALAAWNSAGRLADHWTSVHRQPNFAQGAVQVVIGNEPVRQQDRPLVALSVVGQATQISLNVAAGQPPLAEQQGRLRQAAALAFLHTAELDRQLPEWVCQGLAAYVGDKSSESRAEAPLPTSAAPPLGGSQWRLRRVAPDRIAEPPAETAGAAQLVEFLIEGNDARHAGEFFDALRSHLASAPRDGDRDFRRRNDASLPAASDSQPLVRLAAAVTTEFEQWKVDPLIGQPMVAADDEADDELKQSQQSMLFALKLAERFALAESAAIRTRITTFEKGRGAAVLKGASATRPPPLRTLVDRITADDSRSWATLGPDGELIWNRDEEKLRKLLGVDDGRYEHVWHNDRWVLAAQLEGGRQLVGWLELNPDNPQRPLAKFSVKAKPSAEPGHQPVGQLRAQPIEPHQKLSGGR